MTSTAGADCHGGQRCPVEVSERLVGSPAFKAGGTGDPRPAGSIPVHLRQSNCSICVRRSQDVRLAFAVPMTPVISAAIRTVIPHRGRCTMKKLLLAVIVGALIAIVVRRLTDA